MTIIPIVIFSLMAFIYVIIITWGILEWKSGYDSWRLAIGACFIYTAFLMWIFASAYSNALKNHKQLQNNTAIEQVK